jgi:glucose-1-phosphate cytidylyltransferase
MKVVILAGGVGSRLSEETDIRPKPMVEIGGKPILWHIMKHYEHYGFNEFIICLGYKGEYVKKYFSDSLAFSSDLTIDFAAQKVIPHDTPKDSWKVTLVDTGASTETAGRLQKIRSYVDDAPFLMTYGDGVSNVNLHDLQAFHTSHGKLATVTAVHPIARFGQMTLGENGGVSEFTEKPQMESGWINGGFFILDPKIFDFIPGNVDWAKEPMEGLAQANELHAFQHEGFWQCMDMIRDKMLLESLWEKGAPWKCWK